MKMDGLNKNDKRLEASSDDLEALVSSSAMTTKQGGESKSASSKVDQKYAFKVYNFSLTETISDDIDNLCLTRTKINRSDVIKCGIRALQKMSKSELLELMNHFMEENQAG